jgi:hypothetical protein
MRLGIVLLLAGLMLGCSQPDKAVRILTEEGYTHVEITGWRPFSCGKDDDFATGFRAISPSGHEVTGVVCSGFLFKAATVRLD